MKVTSLWFPSCHLRPYCIPRDPPSVVNVAKLLEVAPDDPTKPLEDTPEARCNFSPTGVGKAKTKQATIPPHP